MTTVSWMTAFLDLPPDAHETGTRFWTGVTGYAVSPPRGADAAFTTFLPPQGDPFLKVQRTGAGGSAPTGPSVHLDVHVVSAEEASARARSFGATVTHSEPDGYIVMRSPGGFTFCFVHEQLGTRPGPARWSQQHESIVDQVCLDIPARTYEAECTFWSELTRWPQRNSLRRSEFRYLERPDGMPIRLLLQRLDVDVPSVTGHLDLACDDRQVEVARHEQLGASVVADHGGGWTTLRDPAGSLYCVTDRTP